MERSRKPRCRSLSSKSNPSRTCARHLKLLGYEKQRLLTRSRKSTILWASFPWKLLAIVILVGQLKRDWTLERHSFEEISDVQRLIQNRVSNYWMSRPSTGAKETKRVPKGPFSQDISTDMCCCQWSWVAGKSPCSSGLYIHIPSYQSPAKKSEEVSASRRLYLHSPLWIREDFSLRKGFLLWKDRGGAPVIAEAFSG